MLRLRCGLRRSFGSGRGTSSKAAALPSDETAACCCGASPPLLVLVHNCTTSLLESLEADCSAAGSEKLSVAVQAMDLDAAPPCGVTTCGQK